MTPSPSRPGGGYGYGYPAGNGTAMNGNLGVESRGFRPATPNKRSVRTSARNNTEGEGYFTSWLFVVRRAIS